MITPDDVAVELGRPLPLDSATTDRWSRWIDRARRQIGREFRDEGGIDSLDPDTVDDVVLLAVSRHAGNPDGVESEDLAVDDARRSRRYSHAEGAITITDEWWSWLRPSRKRPGAFTIKAAFRR